MQESILHWWISVLIANRYSCSKNVICFAESLQDERSELELLGTPLSALGDASLDETELDEGGNMLHIEFIVYVQNKMSQV